MAEEEALEGPTATAPALLPTMPGIIPQELSHEECFNVRNRRHGAMTDPGDMDRPVAQRMTWMKRRQGWHAASIDGRYYDVQYIGQGWGRAVAMIRGDFPDIGEAVLKVTSSESDQNRREIDFVREIDDGEEAAIKT